jgi:nitrogen fixation protein NifB
MSQCKGDHDIAKHPCFSAEAHGKFGRIHLPVSPVCNIQCRFCKRGFNKDENRPGVSRALLAPEDAVGVLDRAVALCPELTVVGIAGPGDTLAGDYALETFRLVHARYPNLIKCLSTNGLLLKEKIDGLVKAGVRTITVTINAVEVKTLARICSHIMHNGQYITGEMAARWLILAQLAGIDKAVSLGVTVKVNTVLIPGINDQHIGEIAKTAAHAGAAFINIIPLIPEHEFRNHRPPDCRELKAARRIAGAYLPVINHCQQCRADACGIPGGTTDFAAMLYDRRAVESCQ